MEEIKEKDLVDVTMSSGKIVEGCVVRVTHDLTFNYIVRVLMHGRSVELYCNREDLSLTNRCRKE